MGSCKFASIRFLSTRSPRSSLRPAANGIQDTYSAKLHFLKESRWVTSRIINDDGIFLLNSILVGYFRADQFEEVLEEYLTLRRRNIGLNTTALTFTLKSCVGLGWLGFGKIVHADALKFGFSGNPIAGSALVGIYSKLGAIEDAAKVFDEMTERDIIAYTSIITAFSRSGYRFASEAFRVFADMLTNQIEPNRVTLVSLLQAAAELGDLKSGMAIHGFALRRGIGFSNEAFETSLMDMYIRCGGVKMASRISGRAKMRTPGSWNALISGYLQIERPVEAFGVFIDMVREKVWPDLISLSNALSACANLALVKEGKSIHGYTYRARVKLDIVASTALLDLYCKCSKLEQAREIYDQIENKDVVVYNVMIRGYAQNGFVEEAFKIYSRMRESGKRPNSASFVSILSALFDPKYSTTCLALHGFMVKLGVDSETEIANQLVNTYTNCSFLNFAMEVFDGTRYKDLVSWTSMMSGHILLGQAEEAIVLFRDMQHKGLNPDSVTLTTLLQAFSRLGFLNSAKEVHGRVYRSLEKLDLPLLNSLITTYAKCGKLGSASRLFRLSGSNCIKSWNAMIAAYAMHGNPENALRLYDRMKSKGLKPDEATFTSILTACSHSGLVDKGLNVFKSIYEEHSMNPWDEHYNCVVDMLSRSGRTKEAYEVLKSLDLDESMAAKGSLLAGCRVYGHRKMGEDVGREMMSSGSGESGLYSLVSNLYAEGKRWEEAASIRLAAKERRVRIVPGYSSIELQ